MPAVKLPDGTRINFPEGTDQATINKVSAETWAKMQGGALAKDPQAQADAAARKEYQQAGFGYDLVDVGRQAIKGIPLAGGLMDEGVALASSAMGGDYNKSLEYQRARDRLREKNFPASSTAVQLAGGVAGTMAGASALGVGGLGVNAARPLAQRALAGAAIGAPVGAVDGFTRGEGGLENRALTAGVGGFLGGVTGAAAPIIGQGVSSGYQNIKNALTPNASYRALGVSKEVGEELVDSLGGDASKKGLARIRAAGPNAMIADAGANAQGVADAVIQKRGPGASLLGDAIEQRSKIANRDLQGTLDRTFGAPVGVKTRQTAIRQGTAQARGDTYDDAYDAAIDYSTPAGKEVAALWTRVRAPRRAAANALLEEAGLPIIEDGALPTVRQIDYVTRALNTVADSAEGQGALGGINDIGRSAQQLARALRTATKTAVPEYGVALDTAADAISKVKAVEFGSKLLRDTTTRETVRDFLRGASDAERRAAMSGLRDQLDEMVANVKGMASSPDVDPRQLEAMMRQLSSGATREKIFMVLNSRKAATQFFREIGQAFQAAKLRASVAVNSKTAARQNLIQGIDERLKPGIIGTAMDGNLPGATQKTIQTVTGSTPRQQRLRNNEQWLELAKLLSEKRGRGAEEMLRKLIAAAQSRAASSASGRKLGVAGASAVAGTNPLLVEGVK